MRRIKWSYDVIDRRAGGGDPDELLSVSIHLGVVPRSSLTDDLPRAIDLTQYKVVKTGDLVLNRMRAFQGAVGVAHRNGIVSPDYLVLRPSQSDDPRFLHHLLRSSWFVGEMVARLRGIGSTETGSVRTPRINAEDLGDIEIPRLSFAEQRAIADYLDTETTRIDALITKKRRMIELLHDRWQAILNRPFSSQSGLRFKRLLQSSLAYGVLVPQHEPDGVPMLRITDFLTGLVDLSTVARIPKTLSDEYRRTIVQTGDLVVSVVGTLGRGAVIGPDLAGSNLNRALTRVQLQDDVGRDLIRLWFGTSEFSTQAKLATSSDAAQPTLNLGDLKNFRVGLPLDRETWAELESQLLERELLHRKGVRTLERQIDLLLELRRALITAAVTGEMDVGVAA